MLARTQTAVLAAVLILAAWHPALGQGSNRTLVAVLAHADDETPIGPVLARYAREGAQVYVVIATDGSQGGLNTSIPRGPELARVREEEARCSATALAIQPPILLGFADGKLGDYASDPSALFRLTVRLAAELQRLRPDAIITWGPDGGVGHPDHRLVSDLVTQLARAGAPGVPQRLFHMYIPAEGFRAINPQRGEPPLLIPEAKYLTVRVSFTPQDLDAAQRAVACHRTQFTPETLQRVLPAQARFWNGSIAFAPGLAGAGGTDLFR
jgi:LmbE family N-acetylglucosaminyl deacetylase